ncbi:PrsW family intramembrane metalloprotease [bacterium]|nr:PrsW family intramembrane metalloprotease [bacterium]
MRKRRADPSVFAEPHLRAGHMPDPSEAKAEAALARRKPADDGAEHTVWDEPGIAPELAGSPSPDDVTYGSWLDQRRAETSAGRSWAVTVGLMLAAGPWAILGALYGSGQTISSIVAIAFVAPLVEEMMKVAAALTVVERRPFLFRNPVQILLCCAGAGAAFATLENLLYIYVYIPAATGAAPTAATVAWRWGVCTALHMGCACIAGMGLVRVWRDVWERKARARLTFGFPCLAIAIAIHGLYNTLALVLQPLE